jgi:hypothetical protein
VLDEIVFGGSIDGPPGDFEAATVVDLGANIGLAYRWFQARQPLARFFCVEPDRANVRAVDDGCAHGARMHRRSRAARHGRR